MGVRETLEIIGAVFVFIFIVVLIGWAFFETYQLSVESSKEYTIQGKLTDVWFPNRAIDLERTSQYWVTMQIDDNCPTMYFFNNDNIFTNNAREKAFNAYNESILLKGKYVELTYKGIMINYFVDIEELI